MADEGMEMGGGGGGRRVSLKNDSSEKEIKTENEPLLTEMTSRWSVEFRKPKTKLTVKSKPLPIDRAIDFIKRQPPLLKGAIGTILTTLPFLIFYLVTIRAIPVGTTVGGHALMKELAEWLFVSTCVLILLFWGGKGFAKLTSYICGLSVRTQKFKSLVGAVFVRLVFLLWSLISYAIITDIFRHNGGADAKLESNWVHTLQQAFRFMAVAGGIILAQGILLEFVAIDYVEGWAGPRSQRAYDELKLVKDLHSLVDPTAVKEENSMMSKVYKKLVTPQTNTLYWKISEGRGTKDDWCEYAMKLWDSLSKGKSAMTRSDFDQRLRDMGRSAGKGEELFTQLDESCDGNVTQEELEKLVCTLGMELNIRFAAQHGIHKLLRKLEILMTAVIGIIIAFIYVEWFAGGNLRDFAMLTMSLTGLGLSFALSGIILQFINQLIFVFAKHPYDVGDYIEAKDKKLVVCSIFFTHSNFEEVSDPHERGTVTQIDHSTLISEPIINWTRTLEAVAEKKKTKAKEKDEKEEQEKDDCKDLMQLKIARLRREEDDAKKKYL